MNKPLHEYDLEQAVEAQARGEQPADTPVEQAQPPKGTLDKRKSKGGGAETAWPSF